VRVETSYIDARSDPVRSSAPGGTGGSPGTVTSQQNVLGYTGKMLVNSYTEGLGDGAVGVLESQEFMLDHSYIGLRVGGGAKFSTRVELTMDGTVVEAAFGENAEELRRVTWNVKRWRGRMAKIRIVDEETGAWGHILVDDIEAFDVEGKDLKVAGEAAAESSAEKTAPVKEKALLSR